MKKKILYQVLILIGIVGLILTLLVWGIYFRGLPKYEVEKINFEINQASANINQGKKIAQAICVSCHFDDATKRLTGRFMTDIASSEGNIYSSNITNHKASGIGGWSNAALAYFLRTGIKPDGTLVSLNYMPRLVHISDKDLEDLIGFLRSDDTLVQGHGKETVSSKPTFKTKLKSILFREREVMTYPKEPIHRPENENTIALGRYLTFNFGCFSCHTSSKHQNQSEPEKSKGYLAGGNQLLDRNGNIIISPNITMDKTGIGTWSKSDFVLAVKHGVNPFAKTVYKFPMQAYKQLSKYEVEAIFDYFQTIEPINNTLKMP